MPNKIEWKFENSFYGLYIDDVFMGYFDNYEKDKVNKIIRALSHS